LWRRSCKNKSLSLLRRPRPIQRSRHAPIRLASDSTAVTITSLLNSRESSIFFSSSPDRVHAWLRALDERHLSSLTASEAARALRALSSCYVERRGRLAEGAALGSAGKRAAFALFYAPLHFFVTREIVRALAPGGGGVTRLHDLGCGTGAAGAAWALECGPVRVAGIDRHPWAVAEANWTYRQLGVDGRAVQGEMSRARIAASPSTGVLAAYAVNELPDAARAALLDRFLDLARRGTRVLVIEPIARRLTPWWPAWERAFVSAGGRADEWRFPADLPRRQHDLAVAAGLSTRELTARSLAVPAGLASSRGLDGEGPR
jgi:hypothetical protein